jgi:hypothetical protein
MVNHQGLAMDTVHVLIPTTSERRQRLYKTIDSVHRNAGHKHIISIYENEGEGWVKAISSMLEHLAPEALAWFIASDVVLNEPNTIKRLFNVFDRFGDMEAVVQPNDGLTHDGPLATMPFCRVSTMLNYGIDTRFFHNYCDVVFTERIMRQNRFLYCPNIRVTHEHFINGTADMDTTYMIALDKIEEDRKIYLEVMADLGLKRTVFSTSPDY